MHAATFSLAARCPATGRLVLAISTAIPGVGGLCCYARAGVGVITTQAWVNPYLAIDALKAVEAGSSFRDALDAVIASDEGRALRQVGAVAADGTTYVWTGDDCTPWCGDISGEGYTIQGNMLVSDETLRAMEQGFHDASAEPIDERAMRALEAGQAVGGDMRGKQSAALIVLDTEDYPWLDLRVDDHTEPVGELRRVLEVARVQYIPFIEAMPKRSGENPRPTERVTDMLLRAPIDRPKALD
jgi:uncharacterized Ntn-hydrolase superfamily protein